MAPPQWDILSTTFDTTKNSDNARSINVIPSISTEDQPREVRLQKDAQFRLQKGEITKRCPPNTCVLIGDWILNGVIERNLWNDRSVKVRKFTGATVNDLRHHALPIIGKQPKSLIIHAGTN